MQRYSNTIDALRKDDGVPHTAGTHIVYDITRRRRKGVSSALAGTPPPVVSPTVRVVPDRVLPPAPATSLLGGATTATPGTRCVAPAAPPPVAGCAGCVSPPGGAAGVAVGSSAPTPVAPGCVGVGWVVGCVVGSGLTVMLSGITLSGSVSLGRSRMGPRIVLRSLLVVGEGG